jgi:hypothetical protein
VAPGTVNSPLSSSNVTSTVVTLVIKRLETFRLAKTPKGSVAERRIQKSPYASEGSRGTASEKVTFRDKKWVNNAA